MQVRKSLYAAALTAAALIFASPALAQETAKAEMKDASGKTLGTITLTQTPAGVKLSGTVSGIPAGEHAYHIHAVGKCEPPFDSAGGHFNPTEAQHGKVAGGPHAGDMDNLTAGADNTVKIDVVNKLVTLKKGEKTSVFDADGSAIIIHAKADDYKTQPTGDAGGRIACGIVQ